MSNAMPACQPQDELTFSRLSAADVAALADLDEETNPHPWTGKQWLDSLEQHECFGAWQGEHLSGFIVCMATLDEAEVLLIAVAPQYQRQNIGSKLLAYAEATLVREGVQQLFLEVRHSNQGARAFYRQHGWQENGVRKNYYPCEHRTEDGQLISREDAIICGKILLVANEVEA
ncbi:ribosomal protein S18-alanine N-acetyltransferase [Chitinibacter bivalviorum]|uniref:Ribosomal protein S18-alanine N-acetyltransferase n=1 Tax=Chitinibacter bivalviorum TaxID=2739434 RepID=A0A7H9BEQ0_9NEIS|nr:ribosomal protein S18-alanine N-acetyltransferase [Chitinibacter bivalviorum]QLG87109.1 ribosomal protein S18-alanine N-acetyltransferase [Chitinibacter bivalviorum]